MCQKTTKHKIITFSAWIAAHITLVVVLVTIVALFFPSSFAWMSTSSITPMLGVVMFGMGLTLTPPTSIRFYSILKTSSSVNWHNSSSCPP